MKKPFTFSFVSIVGVILFLIITGYPGEIKAQCSSGLWSQDWEVKATGATGAYQVIADKDQNVYAIGQDENDQPAGLMLVKYNKEGVERWRRVFVEAVNQTSAQAIAFDNKGNVVVTGFGYGLGHVVTVSYTPDGDFRWANSFGSQAYSYINPRDLANDNEGNTYVTGSVTPTGVNDSYDVFVIKVNKNGVLQWERYYNGPNNKLDVAEKIRVDKKGNVYVGGVSSSDASSQDFLMLKYKKNGDLAWVRTYNGQDNLSDQVSDLEVTEKGDVVVTGNSYSGRATLRYDKNGQQQWIRFAAGPYNTEHSLALDRDEASIISSSINTFDGIEITRYDKNGNTEWVRNYLNATTIERDIQVDEKQNAYVLGAILGSGSETARAVMLIYDKLGNQLFSDVHNFSNTDIVVRDLGLSKGGNFYYGAWDDYGQSDVITVRYEACTDNVYVKKSKKPGSREYMAIEDQKIVNGRLEVWPNPVLQDAQIRFVNRLQGKLSLELYNIYGVRVKAIWQGQLSSDQTLNIPFQTEGLVPGLYLLRGIDSAGEVYLKKVIVQ